MKAIDRRTAFAPILLAALLAPAGGAAGAENIDPADNDQQYAWGENIGWINVEPSGDGGPGAEVGDFGLTGWMWGENIGWISLSCQNLLTCAVNGYGVANDGFGRLTGYAWAENAGWIRFDPDTCAVDPTCGVRIDPVTGAFGGRAWGENIGWITFAASVPEFWTARTSWCQGTSAPPGSGFELTVGGSPGPPLSLSWTALPGAAWYDVVQGRVSTLRSSGGDFAAATDRCVAARTTATAAPVPPGNPPVGEVFWYIARGANCRGHGTYDTGLPSQEGLRDAEIAAAPGACR